MDTIHIKLVVHVLCQRWRCRCHRLLVRCHSRDRCYHCYPRRQLEMQPMPQRHTCQRHGLVRRHPSRGVEPSHEGDVLLR